MAIGFLSDNLSLIPVFRQIDQRGSNPRPAEQDQAFMLNANSVRHRILKAQDWLEKTPEPAALQRATEKLYKRNSDGSLVRVVR